MNSVIEKLSVIVAIYNVEEYLINCIDSIIRQTYKHLEIILVDDGSTDSCGAICDTFSKRDKRIKVIHKKNGGRISARYAGLLEQRRNILLLWMETIGLSLICMNA